MSITTSKQLADFLQGYRKSTLKVSQHYVGKQVGLRQATVSNFESNPGSARVETLFDILCALNLEIEVRPRKTSFDPKDLAQEWE